MHLIDLDRKLKAAQEGSRRWQQGGSGNSAAQAPVPAPPPPAPASADLREVAPDLVARLAARAAKGEDHARSRQAGEFLAQVQAALGAGELSLVGQLCSRRGLSRDIVGSAQPGCSATVRIERE